MTDIHLLRTVYIKVYQNRYVLKLDQTDHSIDTINALTPFSTQRALIGEITAAKKELKRALIQVHGTIYPFFKPIFILHPQEMIEGGLSEAETENFKDLAFSCGARKVVIWTRDEISDDMIKEVAKDAVPKED